MDVYIEIFKKYKWYVVGLTSLLLISFVLFLLLDRDNFASVEGESVVLGTNDISHQAEACSLFVDVSGAVSKPNVYCLSEGSLVIDAIKKAGGFKKNVIAIEYVNSNINLAKPLANNEKIYIPFKKEISCVKLNYELVEKKEEEKVEEMSKSCVSLNSGSLSQLDSLNGIGESLANKIIDARPFKSVEDLNEVSGIGDELFKNLKALVCL